MRQTMRATLVGLALLLWPAALWAAAPAGFVAGVRGEAALERAGVSHEARIGLQVFAGDVLVTGKKARLKVLLSDDSVLALGGGSRVELAEHIFSSDRSERVTRVKLQLGAVRALVQQVVGGKRADFEVRSGTAVAGVRGTEFAVVQSDENTRLVTFSGAVEWSKEGQDKVLVAAGEGSQLGSDGVASPQALAAADLRAVRQATEASQAPTALAWNLGLGDKLGRRPGPPEQAGLAQEVQNDKEAEGGTKGFDFPYDDTNRDGGTNLGGQEDGHSRFGGDFVPNDNGGNLQADSASGDWESAFDMEAPGAYGNNLNLRINVHRTP